MSEHPRVEVHLRWSDMDAFGHVNNAAFVTLFEEARIRAMEAWFGDLTMLADGMVVVRQEIEYRTPLTYRTAPVPVEVWCSDIGASSFDVSYVMRDAGSDVVWAMGETTLVKVDPRAGRPVRLTQAQQEVLRASLSDPAPLRSRRVRKDG